MLTNLKALREEMHLSQVQLAAAVGTTQQNICNYETKGTQPDFNTLIKFADYFHVSVDYLIGRTELRTPAEELYPAAFTADEISIMEEIRELPPIQKESLQKTIQAFKAK